MLSDSHLADISPLAAAAYLRLHGWQLTRRGELGNRWQFRTVDDAVRNVAIPHPELDDCDRALMLSTALRVVEEVEQRSSDLIARELRNADSDVVMFRLVAPRLTDGNIPLTAAPNMLQGALDAITSAGRAEIERRAAFSGGQLPSSVKTFLDEAVVTPTERGSVILNVRSKVDPTSLSQMSIVPEVDRPEHDVPFERRALRRLLSGVRAAKTAVHRDATEIAQADALDDDIEAGLTANLCEALVCLAGDAGDLEARISVGVRWSLFLPSDEPKTIVDIGRSELDVLPSVAETLRSIRPLMDQQARGYVRNLDRIPGHQDGTIRMLADVNGRVSVVRVHLAAADYEKALEAHGRGVELEFVGTLEKAGKIWEVTAPRDIRVLEPA